MLWAIVWILLGIGAVLVLGWQALRVWRKVTALTAELAVVADQAAAALEALDQIEIPARDPAEDEWTGDAADSGFTAARRVRADQAT